MPEKLSTPLVKKDFDPITPAAVAKEEPVDANTPRESSGANSPPSPSNGLVYGPRKRKYEEATEDEKHALNAHHVSNPHLKQVSRSLLSRPHSFIRSFIHPFIHPFVRSSVLPSFRSCLLPVRPCRDRIPWLAPPLPRNTSRIPPPLRRCKRYHCHPPMCVE